METTAVTYSYNRSLHALVERCVHCPALSAGKACQAKVHSDRVFYSMEEFWTFVEHFVEGLPSAETILEGSESFLIHGCRYDRYGAAPPTSDDIANLKELEAFD
jgi:hypothetical protein